VSLIARPIDASVASDSQNQLRIHEVSLWPAAQLALREQRLSPGAFPQFLNDGDQRWQDVV